MAQNDRKQTRIRLAVYGTLKEGHFNHHMLGEKCEVLARNIRIPDMTLYDCGWFPGAVRDAEGAGVVVDVVEIDTSILPYIDAYEGVNHDYPSKSLFTRQVVRLPNGEDALMYLYNRHNDKALGTLTVIPSGKWTDSDEGDDLNDDVPQLPL